jgi:hypothetical protein
MPEVGILFMEKKEWLIREDGTITERLTRERELDAEQSVLDGLAANVFREARNVLLVPDWGTAHASIGTSDIIWSIPIGRIPLKARFRLINHVLVPMFASASDLEMPMEWQAPSQVRLVFVVRTQSLDDCNCIDWNGLFAFNQAHNGYRLPLPNLHEDCTLCTGEFQKSFDTAAECVIASLEQFNKSKWNSDLMRTTEQSQKFFRFRPTDESFETLPIDAADWTSLCDKVSTATMDRIIL